MAITLTDEQFEDLMARLRNIHEDTDMKGRRDADMSNQLCDISFEASHALRELTDIASYQRPAWPDATTLHSRNGRVA